MILITHDLGVVAGMSDHIIVMYAGKVFEQATTRELFSCPGNPYTKGLLRSVPDPTAEQGSLYQIPGLPPDVAHLPPGCGFPDDCRIPAGGQHPAAVGSEGGRTDVVRVARLRDQF